MRFDVAISYVHEDIDQVMSDLLEPLLRCRKPNGERPRIFIDKGKRHGIRPGHAYREEVSGAITSCHHFVPVWSELYWTSKECRWEYNIAFNRDPTAELGIIKAVQSDSSTVPVWARGPQALLVREHRDWFERLCLALELKPVVERLSLEFEAHPVDVQVNETLPAIRVRIRNEAGETQPLQDQISIRAETGVLRGQVTQPASRGVALFPDLFLAETLAATKLVAEAEGHTGARSHAFSVRGASATVGREADRIPVEGRPIFFAGGNSVAVLRSEQGTEYVYVYEVPGARELSRTKIGSTPIRIEHTSPRRLVLCDWEGQVWVFESGGTSARWKLDGGSPSLNVIGAVAGWEDDVLVGFWSGKVYLLRRGGFEEDPIPRQENGVQALAVHESRVACVDLSGVVTVYREGRVENRVSLEPRIRLLQFYPEHGQLIAAGERALYQLPLDASRKLSEGSILGRISAALGGTELPVVVDTEGRGVRIDSQLSPRVVFRAVPGACPTSADGSGVWSVLRNPNGSNSLLRRSDGGQLGRLVHSHKSHLAVSPSGDLLAATEPGGVRLLAPHEMEEQQHGGPHETSAQ